MNVFTLGKNRATVLSAKQSLITLCKENENSSLTIINYVIR